MKKIFLIILALSEILMQAQTIRTYTQDFDSVMQNVNYENAVTTTMQGTVTEHGQAEHRPARVYPNPTDGNLTVEADGTAEVTIYSVSGTKLAEERINGTGTLDLSGLGTGMYFYEIRTENENIYGKLIKK